MIEELDDIFEKDDLIEDIVNIDLDEINDKSVSNAQSVVANISELYYNEEFMKRNPTIKKRIETELDSLRVLIKIRMTDEEIQDVLVKAIGQNSSNASLYTSLTKIQNTIVATTTKINDIVAGLNGLLKGFQLELNFDEPEDDRTEPQQSLKTSHRGSKEFIKQMLGESDENSN